MEQAQQLQAQQLLFMAIEDAVQKAEELEAAGKLTEAINLLQAGEAGGAWSSTHQRRAAVA